MNKKKTIAAIWSLLMFAIAIWWGVGEFGWSFIGVLFIWQWANNLANRVL